MSDEEQCFLLGVNAADVMGIFDQKTKLLFIAVVAELLAEIPGLNPLQLM